MSDEELIDYTDPDIIARQNIAPNAGCNIDGKFYDVRNLVHLASSQADRIKALTAERDQHWDSFVHWRKEADDRSEQLNAARQDAKEAEAYAEELEQERDEAIRRRDAWRAKAEGYDAVRMALREKVGAPWPPNLSRALWAGIAADEKKRADDAEAKLAEFRHALLWCGGSADFKEGGVAREGWLKVCAPLLKGESHDPL